MSAELEEAKAKAEAELEEAKAALEAEKSKTKAAEQKLAGFETRGKAAAKRAKDAQALLDKASDREKTLIKQEDAARASRLALASSRRNSMTCLRRAFSFSLSPAAALSGAAAAGAAPASLRRLWSSSMAALPWALCCLSVSYTHLTLPTILLV